VAVAIHAAVEHLLAWARRAIAQLVGRLPLLRHSLLCAAAVERIVSSAFSSIAIARGPPRLFVSLSTI
jgi:hypothetical protein